MKKEEFVAKLRTHSMKIALINSQLAMVERQRSDALFELRTLAHKAEPLWKNDAMLEIGKTLMSQAKVRLYGGVPTWDSFVNDIKMLMENTGCSLREAKSLLEKLALDKLAPAIG